MPLSGDFNALAAFFSKLKKLDGVSRKIAIEASPKIEALVDATIAAAQSPYGVGWKPKKGGGQALAGSSSAGRVLVRLVGKSQIKTSVLYPYHFHDGGTFSGGRIAMRAVRKKLRKEGYTRKGIAGAIKQLEAGRKTAGNVHDPERPIVPRESEGIPGEWEAKVKTAAVEVMKAGGATLKAGS